MVTNVCFMIPFIKNCFVYFSLCLYKDKFPLLWIVNSSMYSIISTKTKKIPRSISHTLLVPVVSQCQQMCFTDDISVAFVVHEGTTEMHNTMTFALCSDCWQKTIMYLLQTLIKHISTVRFSGETEFRNHWQQLM